MSLMNAVRPSIWGRRFGLAGIGGRIVVDGRSSVNSWLDRGDINWLYDHFWGNQIDGNTWKTSLKGSDGSCAVPALVSGGIGGKCRLTTGAGAGATMAVNGSQLVSDKNWDIGKGHFEFSSSLQMSAITNICVFIGMADSLSLQMPFTISGGTLTMNATDGFGFLFDTAATAATWKIVGGANGTGNAIFDTGKAPVAATDDLIRIEVDTAGNLAAWLNTIPVATGLASNGRSAHGLTPCFAAFTRSAASATVDADYINIEVDRA